MTNIQDYLKEINSPELLLSDHNAEIIDFHDEPTREEIGKWVDRVVDLPSEPKSSCYNDGALPELEDPYFDLANLLITNDLI